MIDPSKFIENRDGVHLEHPYMDYTLCGDADDGDTGPEIDHEPFRATKKRVVTCRKCCDIIRWCLNVKFEV